MRLPLLALVCLPALAGAEPSRLTLEQVIEKALAGPKARMVKEPHAWILGLPLNDTTASPLTVWEGSHTILRAALMLALAPHPPEIWGDIDLTPVYQSARRDIFATCRRVELVARPGEATLLHRLTLHGVAPWRPGDTAPPEGRMIAYLRPQLPSVHEWLKGP